MADSDSNNNGNWWAPYIEYAVLSDLGMRRTNNQDNFRVVPAASSRLWLERGHFFAVADGMGAHAAGEFASEIAAKTISSSYLKRTGESPYDAIKGAIQEAHFLIKQKGEADESFHSMGTTADVLLLLPEGALNAHVGDSRTYRLRDGVYEQITFDHSLLWELTKSEKAKNAYLADTSKKIPKNIITRSLGPGGNPKVDLEGPFPLKPGDVFLLCSDGLSGQVYDEEMAQILSLFKPTEAVQSLVNLANFTGGPDNITVVVVKVLKLPNAETTAKEAKAFAKRPPVPIKAWFFLTGSLAFLLLVLLLMKFLGIWSLVLMVGAVGCILLFLWSASPSFFPKTSEPREHQPFGKGPYARVSAAPTYNLAVKLLEIYIKINNAIHLMDPAKVAETVNASKRAIEGKHYAKVIQGLMREINKDTVLMKSLKPDVKTSQHMRRG